MERVLVLAFRVSKNSSCHHLTLFFLKSFFNESWRPLNHTFLKDEEDSRTAKLEISFLLSSRKCFSYCFMIGDRADIGRAHFEPEYVSEIRCTNSHQMRFVVYPESSIQDTIINRIQWPLSRSRGENLSVVQEMKSMVIRKSESTKTYITSDEIFYICSEKLEKIRMISLHDKIICHRNISE